MPEIPLKLRVNNNIQRAYLWGAYPAGDMGPHANAYDPGHASASHNQVIPAACDAHGQQYVIANTPTSREFSEYVMLAANTAVDRVFLGRRFLLDGLYGFNTDSSAMLYIQLWKTANSYAGWPTAPSWAEAMTTGTLLTQFPVQPNGGTFSLDIPWVFRGGLSIAISTTLTTWTSAGNKLCFTAMMRMREDDVLNTD